MIDYIKFWLAKEFVSVLPVLIIFGMFFLFVVSWATYSWIGAKIRRYRKYKGV